jgi:hypothetical protein
MTVIKCTRFVWGPDKPNLADPPVWGLMGVAHTLIPLLGGSEELWEDFKDLDEAMLLSSRWDEWEEVPESQWPKEVRAALAVYRLTGGNE